jgi:hypothetical protein
MDTKVAKDRAVVAIIWEGHRDFDFQHAAKASSESLSPCRAIGLWGSSPTSDESRCARGGKSCSPPDRLRQIGWTKQSEVYRWRTSRRISLPESS